MGVNVEVGLGVRVGLAVGLGVGVEVDVGVLVEVGVGVGVDVAVLVGVAVGVGVHVGVDVSVRVEVGVGVEVPKRAGLPLACQPNAMAETTKARTTAPTMTTKVSAELLCILRKTSILVDSYSPWPGKRLTIVPPSSPKFS